MIFVNSFLYGTELDGIFRALESITNSDNMDSWKRNIPTFEKLKDLILLFPQIEGALDKERDALWKYVEEIIKEQLKDFKHPNTVRLGGWWYELISSKETNAKLIHYYSKSGKMDIELDPFSKSYSTDYEDGSTCMRDDMSVMVYENK